MNSFLIVGADCWCFMHELNICVNIINALEERLSVDQFSQIRRLWLEVGELAGIEIEALRFSFPIAASQSIAKLAQLEIISIPGKALCYDCQCEIFIKKHFDSCPLCGHYNYHITQGKELRIIKMEVE